MHKQEDMTVRLVCPWRGNRPGDVVTVKRSVGFELVRCFVAVPSPAVIETTAFTSPAGQEVRNAVR